MAHNQANPSFRGPQMGQRPSMAQPSSSHRSGSYNIASAQRGRQNDSHQNQNKPQLVQLVESLMEKQGVEYYEKNVANQLIEFMHYYVTETVQDAKMYRDYAGKERVDVGDMRLAIASKNYDSFTRPLPVSTVRTVADEKNKQALPAIDTIQSVAEQVNSNSGMQMKRPGQQIQPPNTLPTSQEAHTLMAPNVHVFSEEIKAQIEDNKKKMLRLAIMQFQKSQEQQAEVLKKGQKEDKKETNNKRKSKQKENAKKKNAKADAQESNNSAQKSDTKKDQNMTTDASNAEKNSSVLGQPSAALLGKRKAQTQIDIEFDPASLQQVQDSTQQDGEDANGKSGQAAKQLFPDQLVSQGVAGAMNAQPSNPFGDSQNEAKNNDLSPMDFAALQDNDAEDDLDNPFDLDMLQNQSEVPDPIADMQQAPFEIQPKVEDDPNKTTLSSFLPQMDLPEPEDEGSDDQEENPFMQE